MSIDVSTRMARRHQKVRDRMLDAARVVLVRDGLEGLTIGSVADEADVSKSAMYYYFEDKEALLRELIFEGCRTQVATLAAAVRDAPTGLEALRSVARGFDAFYGDRLPEFRLHYLWSQVMGIGTPELAARLEPVMNGLFDEVHAKLIEDRAAGRLHAHADPRRLAVSAWMIGFASTSFRSLFETTRSSSRHAFGDLFDELSSAFVRGASAR